MAKRMQKSLVAAAALASMALGGATLAQADSPSHGRTATEKATQPDRDNVQSGDQTTPDTTTKSVEKAGVERADPATENAGENQPSDGPGGHADPATENGGENQPSDGPGGHADPAGNVDHQFQGNE